MFRLFTITYTLAGTTLARSAIVAALTLNMFDYRSVIGAVAESPVAWIVAKRLSAA